MRKARLKMACRRGMLELDLLLLPFLENTFDKLSTEEKENFELLLTLNDQVLYNYFIKGEIPNSVALEKLIDRIRIDKGQCSTP